MCDYRSIMSESPVEFSAAALDYFLRLQAGSGFPEPYLRIGMRGGACGGQFVLGFDAPADDDEHYLIDGIPVLIDRRQLLFVLGTVVEFSPESQGFYLHKPKQV